MTYGQLLVELQKLNTEQLGCDVTVEICTEDEYFPAEFRICEQDNGVLDSYHPVIVVCEK